MQDIDLSTNCFALQTHSYCSTTLGNGDRAGLAFAVPWAGITSSYVFAGTQQLSGSSEAQLLCKHRH